MNLLLIDRALPSSVFSGKTVRLKHIYGRLAKKHKIVYLRTAQPGQEPESGELETWATNTFEACLRLPTLDHPKLLNRLSAVFKLKPWYDLFSKHPDKIEKIKSCLSEIVNNHHINAVITFDQEVAQYGLLLAKEIPWIQDLGDSMSLQLKRQMSNSGGLKHLKLLWRSIRESRFEHEMVSKAASNIFVAEDDAVIHRNGKTNSIHVISNGVDTEFFNADAVQPIKTIHPFVVFTGHMNFLPNQDAVVYFAREIFPIIRKQVPNLEFKIVGADPSEEVLKLREIQGIEVTGKVADLRPYLKSASAFVCAMRMGTGIKNKLLEAMSMELPIITTSLGLKGISGVPDGLVDIADTPEEFSDAVIRKVSESSLRGSVSNEAEAISESGLLRRPFGSPRNDMCDARGARDFVQTHYSWNGTVERYQNLLSELKK